METHVFTTGTGVPKLSAGDIFTQNLGRQHDYMHYRRIKVESIIDDTHFSGFVIGAYSEKLDESGCKAEFITEYQYNKDLDLIQTIIKEHAEYMIEAYSYDKVLAGIGYFFRTLWWKIVETCGFKSGRWKYHCTHGRVCPGLFVR